MSPQERHEPNREHYALGDGTVVLLLDERQLLYLVPPAHRNAHPAARLELPQQGRGNFAGSGRHDNRVKGGMLVPSEISVSASHLDVLVSERLQPGAGLLRQSGQRFPR